MQTDNLEVDTPVANAPEVDVDDLEMDARPSTATVISDRINTFLKWFENHWLLAFNVFWAVFVLLPWTAPVFMETGLETPGRGVYFVYNFFCHQLPERSWFLFGPEFSYTQPEIAATGQDISHELVRRKFIGTPDMGWKVAWSDRMVSMYGSILVFGLLYAFLRWRGIYIKGIPWWAFFLFIIPMGLDGTTHLINDALRLDFRDANQWAVTLTNGAFPASFYAGDMFGSLNSLLRLVTGILFGLGVVWFMWPLMDEELGEPPVLVTLEMIEPEGLRQKG